MQEQKVVAQFQRPSTPRILWARHCAHTIHKLDENVPFHEPEHLRHPQQPFRLDTPGEGLNHKPYTGECEAAGAAGRNITSDTKPSARALVAVSFRPAKSISFDTE
jgi:hypothetical protein